jgi:small basic protein
MATSTGTGTPVNITLKAYDLYLGIVVLGVLAGVLGFVTHTIASWIGYAGVAAAITVIVGYLADEFVPQSWVEYLVVTIIVAVLGVVGSLTGVQNVDLIAILTWVTAILAAIYHSVSETGGVHLTAQQETWAIGLTGAALSFFTWWLGDPTATTAAIIATLVATVGQFLRVSVKTSAPQTALSAAAAAPAAPPV